MFLTRNLIFKRISTSGRLSLWFFQLISIKLLPFIPSIVLIYFWSWDLIAQSSSPNLFLYLSSKTYLDSGYITQTLCSLRKNSISLTLSSKNKCTMMQRRPKKAKVLVMENLMPLFQMSFLLKTSLSKLIDRVTRKLIDTKSNMRIWRISWPNLTRASLKE